MNIYSKIGIPVLGLVVVNYLASSAFAQTLSADSRQYAQEVTVLIARRNSAGGVDPVGSGVIIAKSGNTYDVLTATHNFGDQAQYAIKTYDSKIYNIEEINKLSYQENLLDLTVVRFSSTSKTNYRVVEVINNSSLVVGGTPVYICGFPQSSLGFEIVPGEVTGNDKRDLAQLIQAQDKIKFKGYNLRYNAETDYGMSGGPILDSNNRLVGIHGRQSSSESSRVKIGIKIDTFWAVAPSDLRNRILSPNYSTPSNGNQNLLNDVLVYRGTLESGDSVLASDKSLYDEYTFEGKAGQRVSILLESSDFDTYLAVFTPNGELWQEHDDISNNNSNAQITVTLPTTGTYRVIVNAYNSQEKGRYTLKITL